MTKDVTWVPLGLLWQDLTFPDARGLCADLPTSEFSRSCLIFSTPVGSWRHREEKLDRWVLEQSMERSRDRFRTCSRLALLKVLQISRMSQLQATVVLLYTLCCTILIPNWQGLIRAHAFHFMYRNFNNWVIKMSLYQEALRDSDSNPKSLPSII